MKTLASSSRVAIFSLLVLGAAGAVWLLCRPDPPIWRLRTVFHLGISINPAYVINESPNPEDTLEHYRAIVAFISTPSFRQNIADTSQFEPASASLSKGLVFDTLRPHALNDYDIEIDFAAASAADCRAAYRNIAHRVEQRHALLFDENVKVLQAAIDDYRERSTQLEKWEDAKTQSENQASTDADSSKPGLGVIWSETREHLRRLEAIKPLMKPTSFPSESDIYVNGPLSNNSVRLSALAGLAVILCALVLMLGLEIRPPKRRNMDT
jgi:hypothetical protein